MANFTEGKGWKLFMGKLYGLGAAVVIVGALFKLEHFPGASIMLIVGMSVEAFIFICSAFEPLPHPEPRWELVYPELGDSEAGHEGESPKEKKTRKNKTAIEGIDIATAATGSADSAAAPPLAGSNVAAVAAIGSIDLSKLNVEKLASGLNKLGETAQELTSLSETVVAANTLSEKMHHASLTVANFSQSYENSSQTLSESMHTLVDTYQGTAEAVKISGKQMGDDISKTGKQVAKVMDEAAEDFAKTVSYTGKQISDEVGKTSKQVADVMGAIVESFAKSVDDSGRQVSSEAGKVSKQMADTIAVAATNVAQLVTTSGKSVSDEISRTGKQMADMIGSVTENFAATFTIIDRHIKDNLYDIKQGNATYNKQVEVLNKNLTALNTVYELQAQETGKYHKNSAAMGQHLEKFVVELNRSADENRSFNKEITQLNKNIADLNGIYGSMLSAVQLAAKKK
ncbi:MAG: gliding motility protein GldL [Prevotellaceae bacterium]|jgi:gliding motility-associated protein GldL|nr:gliding motility protein GldL [Prevotellaceae bacterium]